MSDWQKEKELIMNFIALCRASSIEYALSRIDSFLENELVVPREKIKGGSSEK